MYEKSRNHIFLYHAYALPFGGWVHDKNGQFTALPSIAPSVLSITGGFASASEKHVNFAVPGKYQFGEEGPKSFYLYVGHAYSEVRGTEGEDEGAYTTTVRSVLDDVRINDDLYIEHSEAILRSTHDNPGKPQLPGIETPKTETPVWVGASEMYGVRVRGAKVNLEKHADIDRDPVYTSLHSAVRSAMQVPVAAGAGSNPAGTSSLAGNSWPYNICNWHDEATLGNDPPLYAKDHATINQNAQNHLRYSIFQDVDVPRAREDNSLGVTQFKSSVEVENFGRIFFGEVVASNGMKQLTMFRINLGCDNCGDAGGSGGTTNGGPMP